MTTFKIDYDSIDVEAIMAQIRQRVKEKKGVVYTDDDLRNLSALELEKPKEVKMPEGEEFVPLQFPERVEFNPPPRQVFHDQLMEQLSEQIVNNFLKYVDELEKNGGRWNLHFEPKDHIKVNPGLKGKYHEKLRRYFVKVLDRTYNVNAIMDEIHRQWHINYLVHDTMLRQQNFNEVMIEKSADLYQSALDHIKHVTNIYEKEFDHMRKALLMLHEEHHNHMQIVKAAEARERQMQQEIRQLRGIIEGQRQQIDYMLQRQRTLEKMAVLKDDSKDEAKKKSSDLEKGRYGSKDSE